MTQTGELLQVEVTLLVEIWNLFNCFIEDMKRQLTTN